MRIEITHKNQTDTVELPSDTDLVGMSLGTDYNQGEMFNICQRLPKTLGGAPVECETEKTHLANGMLLTTYIYKLGGKAKVLSLKKFIGLVHCDILCENVRLKFII